MCRLDFAASDWFGWGLMRTTELATGGGRCDFRFKRPPKGKKLHFRSLLAVPIISREKKVIGVISADDPEIGHFDETHKQLLIWPDSSPLPLRG